MAKATSIHPSKSHVHALSDKREGHVANTQLGQGEIHLLSNFSEYRDSGRAFLQRLQKRIGIKKLQIKP